MKREGHYFQDLRRRHEALGHKVTRDVDGRLIIKTENERIEYDADEQGGHYIASGPSGMYVDKFGDS
jgi:hypothetical protein